MRRPLRARAVAAFGVLAVTLVAVAVAAYGFGGADPSAPMSTNLPPATATVTRQTLTQTERVGGTLGFGPVSTVLARASATAIPVAGGDTPTTNTVTWLPPVGTVVEPGQPMFKVDDQPVVLLSGTTPPYRLLSPGVRGVDVTMLETNLSTFGYRGFTVDTAYTTSTAAAVKRWQSDLGRPQTGMVDVDQVVVAPGPIRVGAHRSALGADASGPVLDYTGTTRTVTIPLAVSRQHLVHKGLSATVTLPDGTTVAGTVVRIGTVATAGSEGQDEATVEVTVTVADQAALGALDGAPVQLTLVTAQRDNVLTVPVGALLALAEGGYGVQVVEGSTTRYLAVQTGMFAAGRVEVSGSGVTEGLTVGVPA